jgi:hypothetical protein
MATTKPTAAAEQQADATTPAAEQLEARALVDLPHLDVRAGGLLVAAAAIVAQCVRVGEADDHPDAIAYAKAQA